MFKQLVLLLFAGFHAVCASAQQQNLPPISPTNQSTVVYLVLKELPAATIFHEEQKNGASPSKAASRVRAQLKKISAEQEKISDRLKSHKLTTSGNLQRLVNAVRVETTQEELSTLAQLPEVREVVPSTIFYAHQSAPPHYVGSPSFWTNALQNIDGNGIRIGIIDSGIDYHHATFGGSGDSKDFEKNDPTILEPGSFPTKKVVGGYDFAGDDYDPTLPNALPEPDKDPLDCAAYGHGTHVAALAAGFGTGTNGHTFTNDYRTARSADFSIPPGVAPRARLYAIKVFGCAGSTRLLIDALDWAADPNNDGDFTDRLDVLNISIGSPLGVLAEADLEQQAIGRLAQLGTICVLSAGNSGDTHYVVSSPSIANAAISVANSTMGSSYASAEIIPGAGTTTRVRIAEALFGPTLVSLGQIEAEVAVVSTKACEPLPNPEQTAGKIVLIDRGDCLFVEKVLHAQQAGAAAVVIANNIPGPPFSMSGNDPSIEIVSVMVGKLEGELLRQAARAGVVRLRLQPNSPLLPGLWHDQPDSSSSRGPSSPSQGLKPDIAAPGAAIFSAKAGSGNGGIFRTGTSMSAPLVAGAAALLRQLHPSLATSDIKALLMNHARVVTNEFHEYFPETSVGAGRLELVALTGARTILRSRDNPEAVSLSWGLVDVATNATLAHRLLVTNFGTAPQTYKASVSTSLPHPVIRVSISPEEVSLKPGASTELIVTLEADFRNPSSGQTNHFARNLVGEISGQIWLTASNPEKTIHLPWHGVIRKRSELNLPLKGVGAKAAKPSDVLRLAFNDPNKFFPLGIFELGQTNATKTGLPAWHTPSDLVAVGVYSDFPFTGSAGTAWLHFAIVTAKPWTSPQNSLYEFNVYLDTNLDGTEDFRLVNSSRGTFSPLTLQLGDPSDDFVTAVQNLSTGLYSTNNPAAPTNQFRPGAFNENIWIASVPMKSIGLTTEKTAFRYRVTSFGPRQHASERTDQISGLRYTATQPGIKPGSTVPGPFFTGGPLFDLNLNPENLATNGGTRRAEQTLLLLLPENAHTSSAQLLKVDLSTSDIDKDDLPDLWELVHFPNLQSSSGLTDTDADGASDKMEFLSGTDPHDRNSKLGFTTFLKLPNGKILLRWQSVPHRTYAIESAAELGGEFHLEKSLKGSGELELPIPSGKARFYRLRVLTE